MKNNFKPILFIALLINASTLFAQLSAVYCSKVGKSECMLSLFKNGSYDLVIYTPPEEYQCLDYLSFGNYRVRGDRVYCRDRFNGYELIFKKVGSDLIPVLAYPGLMKHPFVFWPEYSKYMESAKYYQFDPSKGTFKTSSDLRQFYASNKTISFVFGIYKDRDLIVELNLQRDGHYQLKIQDVVFSKGKWARKNNELQFYDDDLKVTYFSFINDKAILFGFLSIGYDALKLFK